MKYLCGYAYISYNIYVLYTNILYILCLPILHRTTERIILVTIVTSYFLYRNNNYCLKCIYISLNNKQNNDQSKTSGRLI